MAASASDKFQEVAIATATTLDANYTIGDTSITVASTANMPTATGITFAMDVIDSNGEQVAGTYNEYVGVVSTATSITSVSHQNGTNRNYSAGATTRVYLPVSAERENRLVEGILTHANQSGDIVAQNTATFQSNIDVNDSSTAIRDSSDNELVKFAKTSSAVNEITVTNAATAGAPSISATGGDTNIDLRLVPKGTGNVKRGTTGGSIDWWEEIGRTTLGSAGDTITVSSIPARKYLRIIVYTVATGGTTDLRLRFNNDSGSNYAYRESSNGGADNTAVSQSSILVSGAAARTYFYTVDVLNVAAQEKYTSGLRADTTAGAGNAPNKVEQIGKWANTTDQITRVDILNTAGTGDYDTGSEVVVLGHD